MLDKYITEQNTREKRRGRGGKKRRGKRKTSVEKDTEGLKFPV